MHILRAGDHRVMPWKNGGGSTTEIAVSPAGAGLETFDWRLSMAGVVEDGPFSVFPGIERTLALLEGGGVVLAVADDPPVRLERQGEMASFPGDAPTRAHLPAGPIRDLNVMTRRGRFTHRLAHRLPGSLQEIAPEADLTVLLARGALTIGGGGTAVRLDTDDAVLLEPGDPPLALGAEAAFFVVTLRAAPGIGKKAL